MFISNKTETTLCDKNDVIILFFTIIADIIDIEREKWKFKQPWLNVQPTSQTFP